MSRFVNICTAAAMLLCAPVTAQGVGEKSAAMAIPDPATVTVPPITGGRDRKVVKDGWKHFYFWRADTSYEEAYADFADCYRFLPVPNSDIMLPRFVNWREVDDREAAATGPAPQYGMVGAVLWSMVSGPIERRASQSRMRRCMEPRGYQRYPASEEVWEQIVDNYSPQSVAVNAKIASGARPDADPLPEDK